ncbi:MAG: hypothetical protein H7Y43_13685, partial [Akkermansiaceae bacterium]|nr:hypothetical protein [Verrucomicrobiales bacterium]
GYEYLPGLKVTEAIPIAKKFLGEKKQEIDDLIRKIASLTPHKCSVAATLYSAWNDLLILKQPSLDEEIIHEARYNWHKEKEKISTADWSEGLKWLRKNNLVPQGHGKLTAIKTLR